MIFVFARRKQYSRTVQTLHPQTNNKIKLNQCDRQYYIFSDIGLNSNLKLIVIIK